MAETGRQASLYSGTDATGELIAHVEVTTAKRGAYAAVSHKLDESWPRRTNSHAVELRITATGITEPAIFATLNQRIDQGTSASYHLAFAQGDSHTGAFVVEQLDETGRGADHRRMRLVLLSDGKTTYAAAS